jgi:hypothetical protein
MILESTEQRSLNTVVDLITETWDVPESKTVEGRFCVVEEGKRKHEDVRTAKL